MTSLPRQQMALNYLILKLIDSRVVKSVDACRMIEFMTKYNETANDSVFDSETTSEEPSWVWRRLITYLG